MLDISEMANDTAIVTIKCECETVSKLSKAPVSMTLSDKIELYLPSDPVPVTSGYAMHRYPSCIMKSLKAA